MTPQEAVKILLAVGSDSVGETIDRGFKYEDAIYDLAEASGLPFEYPDWDKKTVYDFLEHYGKEWGGKSAGTPRTALVKRESSGKLSLRRILTEASHNVYFLTPELDRLLEVLEDSIVLLENEGDTRQSASIKDLYDNIARQTGRAEGQWQ